MEKPFQTPCKCCCITVENVRYFDSGDALSGWYGECAECHTTRFEPATDEEIYKKLVKV